jgi:hypothetical protein
LHVWHCRHTPFPRCACCDAAARTRQAMCASPLLPRHAQPDWMGGGLVSRQMMHAAPSAAIPFLDRDGRRRADEWAVPRLFLPMAARQMVWQPGA